VFASKSEQLDERNVQMLKILTCSTINTDGPIAYDKTTNNLTILASGRD
jgi:hypothetical protein